MTYCVFSICSFTEHLSDVEQVLIRLRIATLKVNAAKSSFSKTEIDYLRYIVSREGIKSQLRKIEAIMKIACLKNVKDVCRCLGMV